MRKKILIENVIESDIKVLSGRIQGEKAREKLKIMDKDSDEFSYDVEIPDRIRTFNPSYFLGIFCESIKEIGLDLFLKKYSFISTSGQLKKGIEDDIEEGIEWVLEELGVL
ncbi:MAG: hypothetical protein ACRC6E_01120 [Fusobacteriaceae bacterium]